MTRRDVLFALAMVLLQPVGSHAQTTAGIGTTIVFPVTAQTASFTGDVTVFNPGPNALTAHVTFFEANNSSTPGTKVCTDASVPASRSVHFSIGTQCALAAGSHFGLLVVADSANPQSHSFYGYTRVQNPQGIGFSVEGFPVQNFNNQVSHATGLKRQTAAPTFQTNCFVGSLEQPVSYELKLFNDTTGAQIGNTLTGALDPFEQIRYLDVFGVNGVNAPAGDQFNVRAQFTQTSGGTANLIGFCTVQDNTSFGADFRIAKSFGSPSNSFFAQGGNTFGTVAQLGTNDNQPLEIKAAGQRAMRFEGSANGSANVIGGSSANSVAPSPQFGQTIGGGGFPGTCDFGRPCQNQVTASLGTIGGGYSNVAAGHAVVAGGYANTASAVDSAVMGGIFNTASGDESAVLGGEFNTASGHWSVAAGLSANATHDQSFVWGGWSTGPAGSFRPNAFQIHGEAGLDVEYGARRADGGGTSWVFIGNGFVGQAIATSTGAFLSSGGVWTNNSDRARKTQVQPVDPLRILDKVVQLPVATWQYIAENATVRHIGPMAQDFYATFGFGAADTSIATVDADGVALVAIQGLHRLVRDKDDEIHAQQRALTDQQREIAGLREELDALKRAVAQLARTVR